LRRMMAKELQRPEHAKTAYENFLKAQELARKIGAQDVEGRILADWSLLYSDNGQAVEAKTTINQALMKAPQDAQVNVDYATHLYRQNLFQQAQKYVEKALFLEPSNWQALWYQFKICERFTDIPKAMATLKEIVRYYPWSKLAAERLQGYQMLTGQQKMMNSLNPATPKVKPPAVPR
jgi:tetratricopeptide (TPR) repeat protein